MARVRNEGRRVRQTTHRKRKLIHTAIDTGSTHERDEGHETIQAVEAVFALLARDHGNITTCDFRKVFCDEVTNLCQTFTDRWTAILQHVKTSTKDSAIRAGSEQTDTPRSSQLAADAGSDSSTADEEAALNLMQLGSPNADEDGNEVGPAAPSPASFTVTSRHARRHSPESEKITDLRKLDKQLDNGNEYKDELMEDDSSEDNNDNRIGTLTLDEEARARKNVTGHGFHEENSTKQHNLQDSPSKSDLLEDEVEEDYENSQQEIARITTNSSLDASSQPAHDSTMVPAKTTDVEDANEGDGTNDSGSGSDTSTEVRAKTDDGVLSDADMEEGQADDEDQDQEPTQEEEHHHTSLDEDNTDAHEAASSTLSRVQLMQPRPSVFDIPGSPQRQRVKILQKRSLPSLQSSAPQHPHQHPELEPTAVTKGVAGPIEFPHARLANLTPGARRIVPKTDSLALNSEQIAFYAKYTILPISMHQWRNIGSVIEEMQPILTAAGYLRVQPDWQTSRDGRPSIARGDRSESRNAQALFHKTAAMATDWMPSGSISFHADDIIGALHVRGRSSPQQHLTTRKNAGFKADILLQQGPALSSEEFTSMSHPDVLAELDIEPVLDTVVDNELPSRPALPGSNEPRLRLCQPGTPLVLAHTSLNLYRFMVQHAGAREWRILPPESNGTLETYTALANVFEESLCDCDLCRCQALESSNVLLPTSILTSAPSLSWNEVSQKPGEVLIIRPGTYFQGVCISTSISEEAHYGRGWLDWKKNRASNSALCQRSLAKISALTPYSGVINSHEKVDLEQLEAECCRIQNQIQASTGGRLPQKICGLIRELPRYVIEIAGSTTLEYINDATAKQVLPHLRSDPVHAIDVKPYYECIGRLKRLSRLATIQQRFCIYRIYSFLSRKYYEKRRKRKRVAGAAQADERWTYTVEELVAGFQYQDQRLAVKATTYLNSHHFKREGAAYVKLIDDYHYGDSILCLLPDGERCEAIGLKKDFLLDLLRHETGSSIFFETLKSLRPRLIELSANKQVYGKIWATIRPGANHNALSLLPTLPAHDESLGPVINETPQRAHLRLRLTPPDSSPITRSHTTARLRAA